MSAKKTARTAPKPKGPTIDQMERATVACVNARAVDWPSIIEESEINLEDVVRAEMRMADEIDRKPSAQGRRTDIVRSSDEVTFDDLGVAVGRSVGGAR